MKKLLLSFLTILCLVTPVQKVKAAPISNQTMWIGVGLSVTAVAAIGSWIAKKCKRQDYTFYGKRWSKFDYAKAIFMITACAAAAGGISHHCLYQKTSNGYIDRIKKLTKNESSLEELALACNLHKDVLSSDLTEENKSFDFYKKREKLAKGIIKALEKDFNEDINNIDKVDAFKDYPYLEQGESLKKRLYFYDNQLSLLNHLGCLPTKDINNFKSYRNKFNQGLLDFCKKESYQKELKQFNKHRKLQNERIAAEARWRQAEAERKKADDLEKEVILEVTIDNRFPKKNIYHLYDDYLSDSDSDSDDEF